MKSKDNSKQKERSIFPDIMRVEGGARSFNILDEIEILSTKADAENSRIFNKEVPEGREAAKNSIVDLIKIGYELPNVDAPERMLLDSGISYNLCKEEKEQENTPYKMVNLISKNFRLPKIEYEAQNNEWDENFLR